jgi:hypothetical protein
MPTGAARGYMFTDFLPVPGDIRRMSQLSPYAPKPPQDELTIPEYSSGRVIGLDTVESMTLRQIADHWNELRGYRLFPSRNDFRPVNLKKLLRHVSLLRVIDGGADYQFRVMGDVHVQAYGENFSNLMLSDMARQHAKFAEGLKIFYEGVRMGRRPIAYRGWIGRDMPETKYSFHEVIYLPLGENEATVDHIVVAGHYVGRGGFHIG